MKTIFVVTAVYMVVSLPRITCQRSSREKSNNFTQLAQKYSIKVEEHNLTTEDGYILKIFHIPGEKQKPVLLMHGLMDSADTFILRGENSLAAVLAKRGYDVWLGNTRGNKYSRRHQLLNPNTDKEFWDFSFHEMGVIDLRVFIDFILRKNSVERLSLIGHSLGNTLFYVLGSMKPEYNDKIKVAIALAPICYVNYDNYKNSLYLLYTIGHLVNQLLVASNQEELFGHDFFLTKTMENVCRRRGIGYRICGAGIFAEIAGGDLEEFEPEFFYYVLRYYPNSISRKCGFHLLQLGMRKEFAQFDYGPEKNFEIYKTETSPRYELEKVTMNVALFVGKNDKLTPLDNVVILRDKLPNVVTYHVMEREKFNHLDFVWGRHMYKYLFTHIFKILNTHS